MKKCELLVPAGGPEQFIAAVENGADAIYIGGKEFSARANAENFSDAEAEKAIDYGHLRGVKTYVAMNTLFRDYELGAALEQARKYCAMGADALIIQDLGLGNMIRQEMPELPLHLSTQAGVCDRRGAEAAAKLGYERVVLARELTFDEIKDAVNSGIEIEVFVHGAMCICYSGQCQLSRFIGGRSGNRGACAQPCRLPYKGGCGSTYPLSPKDMCLIEEVGMLAEAGVASLKIEGRMKSAEYVAIVTSIYRKYLDMWCREGRVCVSHEDKENLRQAFNRGGFTKGYFYGDPGEKLMTGNFSKNEGVYVGTIAADSRGPLVDVHTDMDIIKGDYIEIRSKTMQSGLVTYCSSRGEGIIRLGDIRKEVKKGDKVFRLTSAKQMEKARSTFEHITFDEGRYIRKTPVEMKLQAIAGRPLMLTVKCGTFEVTAESHVLAEKSKSGKYLRENVLLQLSKTGGTAFEAALITVEEPEPVHAPLSVINSMRRDALTQLENAIKKSFKRQPVSFAGMQEKHKVTNNVSCNKRLELYFYSGDDFLNFFREGHMEQWETAAGKERKLCVVLPVEDISRCREETGCSTYMIPYMPDVHSTKSKSLREQLFERAEHEALTCGGEIYAGNIGMIEELAQRSIKVLGDFALNICNAETGEAYRKLGMYDGIDSLELAEPYMGNYPLMISEHCFEPGTIIDRKGAEYRVRCDQGGHKTVITAKSAVPDKKHIEKLCEENYNVIRIYL